MSSISITFRTEPDKRDEIDRLAESLDRDRSWVINDALKNYLEMNRWQMEQIASGKRDVAEGRYKSLEAVRAKFRNKAAEAAE
jgi:predicted transcriptional regulator